MVIGVKKTFWDWLRIGWKYLEYGIILLLGISTAILFIILIKNVLF